MKTTIPMAALMAALTMTGVAQAQATPDAPPPSATGQAAPPAPGADGSRPGRPDFATLDADGDGQLTQADLRAKVESRFAEADTDGNGGVSAEELLAQQDQRRLDRMNAMIARRDANGDGLLQADEMASRGDRMARMFERLDANDDGSIDADEYEAAADRIGRGDGARGHGGGRDGHDRKPHG